MLPEKIIYLAALLHFGATLIYVVATLRGETRPNRVSWFMWSLGPFIATAAEVANDVGLSSLIVFMSGLGPLLIFLSSFANKKAYWKTTMFDYLCGAMAFLGLVAWYLTRNQDYAIVLSILSDFIAGVPTFKKSYTHPESENGPTYIVGGSAVLLGLFCIQQFTFTACAFMIYLFMMYVATCLLIYRGKIEALFRRIKSV